MDCHLQIFHDNTWLDAAEVSFPAEVSHGFRATSCVFEYDLDYAFTPGVPPISLCLPVDAARHPLKDWPAYLYDLVPQGNGRQFLLGQLKMADSQAANLPLLRAGAFNPIGRVRIREAVAYFEQHVENHGLATAGFTLEELLQRVPEFHETMMVHGMLAAGGTGVQGVAPKYLLTQGLNGRWYPDAALDDDKAQRHYIVKRPRGHSAADRKVLHNEARYLAVAARLGIRCHDPVQLRDDMLFIPRFDRVASDGRVLRLHQESLASIAGLTGFGMQANQFDLLTALRRVVDDPAEETIEFLKRDILNLAMRNTDNHARNTAVQTIDGRTRLTPLFDFAPMYLDPEGIVRASRWYHPESGKELHDWTLIVDALALPTDERARLVEQLHAFGARLATLPALMRECAVDADIVDFVGPSIENQETQLSSLR